MSIAELVLAFAPPAAGWAFSEARAWKKARDAKAKAELEQDELRQRLVEAEAKSIDGRMRRIDQLIGKVVEPEFKRQNAALDALGDRTHDLAENVATVFLALGALGYVGPDGKPLEYVEKKRPRPPPQALTISELRELQAELLPHPGKNEE